MPDTSEPQVSDFSYRDPDVLRREIRYIDRFKAGLTDKMYRFTTRANVYLTEYATLLVRSTDRSHTHLVYRTRNKGRSKIQTLTALMAYLEENDIEYDSHKVALIESIRIDLNDEWARMEYGRLRTLAYVDAGKEIDHFFPDEHKEIINVPEPRTFDAIFTDETVNNSV